MKSILLSFLMLFSLNIFAQDQPSYLRAKNVTFGVRANENAEITWVEEQKECSILVECYKTKIIVNSQKLQTYHILYQVSRDEQSTVWRCKSLDGTTCNVRMSTDPVYPSLLALMVEFNDAVWFYVCTRD
jgi:hypothetical protein